MNMDSLLDWLVRIGVPTQVVSVGAEADDTWCVLREEGTGGEPAWEVFWREQGNRYDWARFTNEQVACLYLFGRLAWTQTVRGAIGLPPSATPPAQAGTPGSQAAAPASQAGTPAAQPGTPSAVAGQAAGLPASPQSAGPVPQAVPAAGGTAGTGRRADESDATPPTGIPTFTVSKETGNSAARLDG
ncbi:hypothetical protein UA75_27410 [Actinoalloteichus sp. GBA129-24]|uniref:Uncharacterized protein n=1 Tax=Actinoalloteichus fjordicus TaxID=1612552 RepID=A0AAC9LJC4_9PSEU|nr:hypothetical protein UA74_26820 [Actinoalloteichus fjordicus]APU23453.1 hypothetical protein UA75_27410 [Actinoalloteichus sp. GBA129-24]